MNFKDEWVYCNAGLRFHLPEDGVEPHFVCIPECNKHVSELKKMNLNPDHRIF